MTDAIARYIAERNELTRIAAQRCMDKQERGEPVDGKTAEWARDFVAMHKPLRGPLGTGAPPCEHEETANTDERKREAAALVAAYQRTGA